MCVAKIVKVFVFIVVGIAVAGLVVMLLWNSVMPALFALPMIRFWQAVGLLLLSRILFGGLRGHGRIRHWGLRRRMMQRWAKMTPEEREKFRQTMRGFGPFGDSSAPKA
jgi:hypothetical protein